MDLVAACFTRIFKVGCDCGLSDCVLNLDWLLLMCLDCILCIAF